MKDNLEEKFQKQNNEQRVKRLIKAVSVQLKDNKLPEASKKAPTKPKKKKSVVKDQAVGNAISASKKAYQLCKQNYCIHRLGPDMRKANNSHCSSTS